MLETVLRAWDLTAARYYRAGRFADAAAVWSILTDGYTQQAQPEPADHSRLRCAAAHYAMGRCTDALTAAGHVWRTLTDRPRLTETQAQIAAGTSMRILCGPTGPAENLHRDDLAAISDGPARLLASTMLNTGPGTLDRRRHRTVCNYPNPPAAPQRTW